ncbi:MAG TPA: hypothetical protein VFF88_08210, partial [Methylocella sp.]|nr:hypothetical protein [Methylocella sp.]
MPDEGRPDARDLFERAKRILLTVGAREKDDSRFHPVANLGAPEGQAREAQELEDFDLKIFNHLVREKPFTGAAQQTLG